MKVFVVGISANRQYLSSYDTFRDMKLRPGDRHLYRSGGRGDVERTYAFEQFMTEGRDCDAIMLCDLDQKFPVDALERLRAHDKDMISGHYMKRQQKALVSIWQWSLEPYIWPYIPYVNPPKAGSGLHRIAASGMGCVLIKRQVVEHVASILPPGACPFEIGKLPEAGYPQSNFGSDYRFYYMAHKLGYQLWGDPDVDCPHAITMWLNRDFEHHLRMARKETVVSLMESPIRNSIKAHGMLTANAIMARKIQYLNALNDATNDRDKLRYQSIIGELETLLDEFAEYSPPPEALELWKQRYSWQNALPEYMLSNVRDIKLPTFGDKDEIEAGLERRTKPPAELTEEQANAIRLQARRRSTTDALVRMNGKEVIGEPVANEDGEPRYIVGKDEDDTEPSAQDSD